MKQFNLEEYLRLKEEGKEPKIVTREGKVCRILCTDRNDHIYPVVGLDEDGTVRSFTAKGLWNNVCETINDLFFAATKHEGWINIYPGTIPRSMVYDIYDTKEAALRARASFAIATAKVEWEE